MRPALQAVLLSVLLIPAGYALASFAVPYRIWWRTQRLVITVDGNPPKAPSAYAKKNEFLVQLADKPLENSFLIDPDSRFVSAIQCHRFWFSSLFAVSYDAPPWIVPFGKMERPAPVFARDRVSFTDWDGRSVTVMWR